MRIRISIIILIFLLSCPGCYNLVEIDNTIGVVAHGMDLSPDGESLLSTAQLALPTGGQAEEHLPRFLLRSATAPSLSLADDRIAAMLPQQPAWDMAATYIIGENLARQDIYPVLDHIGRLRTARESAQLFLAINSSPFEVLNIKMPPEDCPGLALSRIMRSQQEQIGIYSPVTIREFLQKTGNPGIEPVVPQVMIIDNDEKPHLIISGLAVFRGERMVGSLNDEESWGFNTMQSSTRGGFFTVDLPGKASISHHTMKIIDSQTSIKPTLDGGQLKINIRITADGNLYEMDNSDDILDLVQIELLEKAANASIREAAEACISKAQLLHSDILGWGLALQSMDLALWGSLQQNWPIYFATLPYEIEVDYQLRRSYLKDRSIITPNPK